MKYKVKTVLQKKISQYHWNKRPIFLLQKQFESKQDLYKHQKQLGVIFH